jgi:hypothetical protein
MPKHRSFKPTHSKEKKNTTPLPKKGTRGVYLVLALRGKIFMSIFRISPALLMLE